MEQIYEIEDTDPRSAFGSLIKAGEVCGNADCLTRLGDLYSSSEGDVFGIKEDQEKAFHYYDMAIEKGHAGAMFMRGFTLVEAASPQFDCWEGGQIAAHVHVPTDGLAKLR